MEGYQDIKKGERAALLSIIAYLFLAVIKVSVGVFGHSDALFADGLNNTTDVIASVALLIGLRIARIPPDADHAYGHRRTETISSLVASFIMLLVSLEVSYNSILNLIHGDFAAPSLLSAVVALFSGFFMFGIYFYNIRLAKKIDSQAVRAAALDNRSDAYVSFGAFIGIVGAMVGLPWLDAVTALLVGILIGYTAIKIFFDAAHSLTDGFDVSKLDIIHELVREVPDVKEVKDIKARFNGNRIWIDLTISVDASLNVVRSHEITEQIEQAIRTKFPTAYTLVHIEPFFEK
ncbi:cation efflux family protein [Listeria floridensis FSL S10-1187]|uniref:Cation efflux family protein n=1 Tax=Listeria floridensis FSL S10-1187 TaxID=1265817 RepID=A0ABN0RI32_9LIST|nr:cation diffusion facilitator family transporter [Listeria floridensis]EUJ33616.1 cation efflux family protein [Listeria floridensis FSL S10-1187]